MQECEDSKLLAQYVSSHSDEAFARLVSQYVNLVYSAALHHVGNPHQAEEITQAVFIILARKAGGLRKSTVLSGWLYQTAVMTAANFARAEARRARREQEAYMRSVSNESEPDAWTQIGPLLNAAMASLNRKERDAIVLRFFDSRKLGEVGAALGVSVDAANKRINRAVEKLRRFFTRRGIVLSAAGLTAALGANSVHAAPAGLAAASITAAVGKGVAAGGSILALIKATLNQMAWAKLKTAVSIGTTLLLAAGVATVVVSKTRAARIENAFEKVGSQTLNRAPAVLVLRPGRYSDRIDLGVYSGGRFMGRSMPLNWLLSFAYEFPWWDRVVLPADAPKGTYDLLLAASDHPKEALREEIQKQLRFTARRETRRTDVLLLEINNATGPGLQVNRGERPMMEFTGWYTYSNSGKLAATNQPISQLAQFLEDRLNLPVLDRTGLTGNYDLMLQWDAQSDAKSENEVIRRAFLNQLGLKLVPGRESLEMLVVEKSPDVNPR